jgi:hypothetical protein
LLIFVHLTYIEPKLSPHYWLERGLAFEIASRFEPGISCSVMIGRQQLTAWPYPRPLGALLELSPHSKHLFLKGDAQYPEAILRPRNQVALRPHNHLFSL